MHKFIDPYYTLCLRISGTWVAEFGDYELDAVAYEWDVIKSSPASGVTAKDLKIIKTESDQASIEAAIDALNGYNSDLTEVPVKE